MPQDGQGAYGQHISRVTRRPRIAHREHLPLMPVGLVPIDHAASVLRVDLHVLGATNCAAVLDSSGLDAPKNRIEFLLIDSKAEVLDGKGSVVIDEIESQSVINVYRRERSGARFRPAHIQQVRETLGRNALISR